MPSGYKKTCSLADVSRDIVQVLQKAGHVAYFAGGCVRDMLLETTPHDFDVATNATPQEIIRLFPCTRHVGVQFGVVLVRSRGFDIEVATFRSDGPYSDHRHPDSVEFSSPEQDAMRRDFTINGMFFDPIDGRYIDLVDGISDLKRKVIKAIGDPEKRFEEDYLRMLRAIRFATRLGFQIEKQTMEAIAKRSCRIHDIAPERILIELEKILGGPAPAMGWKLICESGLSQHLIKDTSWDQDEARIVTERLELLNDSPPFPLSLTILLSEKTVPSARKSCRNLRASNELTDAAIWLITTLQLFESKKTLELADIKTLLADNRHPLFLEYARIIEFHKYHVTTQSENLCQWIARVDLEKVSPPALLTGDDLITVGFRPGKHFRHVLDEVYRAQLNEEIHSRDEAMQLGRSLLQNDSKE